MKYLALLALATAITSASAACDYISGNYYCDEVSKIIYNNIGYSGSYEDVTNMDEDTGECTQESKSFSGNLSPLDEELSLHFRGPLRLLQFGVYYQSSSSNDKREDTEECSATKHAHHKHVKRATDIVTQTVYVDQNGNTVTVADSTTSSTTTAAAAAASVAQDDAADAAEDTSSTSTTTASTATYSDSESSSTSSAAAGDWVRASYYTPGSTDNCTFLNYYGGLGSGVWSSAFGNSLSYANDDNSGGSSSAVAMGNVTIGSDSEYVIMSGVECGASSETGSCGYYRSGTVAYHGWGGNTKIFVFEFEMPSASSSGNNGDMPAVWMLNAKIPRTLQYGNADCSCWKTGCGELDLFEILSGGSNKLITHLHDQQGASGSGYGGGGSADYFSRPTSGSMKAAVVFTGDQVHILEVSDSFDSVLSSDTVQGWIDESGTSVTIAS